MHKEFGKHYVISTKPLPYWKAYVASYFSKIVAMKILRWDRLIIVDNTKSKRILGLEYRDWEPGFVELAYQLIEEGYIRNQLPQPKL